MILEKVSQGCHLSQLFGHKFVWLQKDCSACDVSNLASQTNLSLPVAQVLLSRGLDTKEKILDFMFPQIMLRKDDYLLMAGAAIAIERINRALNNKERILVFGDYDVDGMTSTSIAVLALSLLGANVNYYLPNREKDGYGLSTKIVRLAALNGYSLVITVDNGTTSLEAAILAKSLGVDLIITDHHQPKGELPDVLALVNPHQAGCLYPYKYFCGAGVIFKLMSFLYLQHDRELPEKVYELLLLGTVADVVPLTGENRYWVKYGLENLNTKSQSFSFKCLAENLNKIDKKNWTSTDIGFGITPQLNALGRLEDPKEAVRFLIDSTQSDVLRIGASLKEINARRREVEARIYRELEQKILLREINLDTDRAIFMYSSDWPLGVIGLVAGRLTNNFGRPSFIFHITKEGVAKGSCRSPSQYNLFEALSKNSDILKTFGGHKQAAGLSLDVENLLILKQRLELDLAARFSFSDLQPSLNIDADIKLVDLNKKLLSDLARLEPFGNENMTPIFLIRGVVLVNAPELIKEKHVKIMIFSDGVCKPVIFFNRPELLENFLRLEDKSFDLVAQILINDFNGATRIELLGLDIRIGHQV